uniref:RPE65 RPE65 homolog n=1 Tax=Phallusia mammillata TaxID=59560 RepID=A0A6F9D823_9ASCI|nr:RPE65 RPE65 homolog [Phallusia mammillata]
MNSKLSGKDKSYPTFIRPATEKIAAQCTAKGQIPHWLEGEVLRNGPGEFEVGSDKFNHLFDGHAFVHKFTISGGWVTYTGRFIESNLYKTNKEHNRILCGGFGTASYTDPCKNIFSRFFTVLTTRPYTDNCNVNVASMANAHYTITDGGDVVRFDAEKLETKNSIALTDILNVHFSTAHPHYDTNGDYYNLGLTFGRNAFYNVVRVPASSFNKQDPMQDLEIHAKIEVDTPLQPTYFHSFALTPNYIVIHDQPARIDVLKSQWKRIMWQPSSGSITNDMKRQSVFLVVDKKTGNQLPIKFTSEGRFCFHFINGFEMTTEDKRYLLVDMCCHKEPINLQQGIVILDNIRQGQTTSKITPTFLRFVMPLDISDSTEEGHNLVNIVGCEATGVMQNDGSIFLTPESLLKKEFSGTLELPRINYKYNGRKYRYFYAMSVFTPHCEDHLMKCDNITKTGITWFEEGCTPSEPVFVERPGATEEDDGIILSTVINKDPNKSVFLLILDAKTFKELARAEVETNLPISFHGIFEEKKQ